jgi:hypothetical protein
MELRCSGEVASCAATQELSRTLWNPKVHYRVHKSPPLAPIQSQISPVHTTQCYLSNILLNIIYVFVFLMVSFFFCFLTNNLHAFLFSPFVLHALPISTSLTWPFYLYLAKSTIYEIIDKTQSSFVLLFSTKCLCSQLLYKSLRTDHNVTSYLVTFRRTLGLEKRRKRRKKEDSDITRSSYISQSTDPINLSIL